MLTATSTSSLQPHKAVHEYTLKCNTVIWYTIKDFMADIYGRSVSRFQPSVTIAMVKNTHQRCCIKDDRWICKENSSR